MGRNGLQYGNAKRSRPLLDNRGFRADIRLRFIMQLSDLNTPTRKEGYMKTLFNIIKTIGVIVVLCILWPIYTVLCVYDSVKNPKPEGYDYYEGF